MEGAITTLPNSIYASGLDPYPSGHCSLRPQHPICWNLFIPFVGLKTLLLVVLKEVLAMKVIVLCGWPKDNISAAM